MRRTHLSQALLALLNARGITITQLAGEVGIHQTTLSRLCAGTADRPKIPSLRALCTQQQASTQGLQLLLAHLRDEVDRSGRLPTDVQISAQGEPPDDWLHLLVDQSRTDNELREILQALAELVRAVRRRQHGVYPEQPPDRG